MPIRTGRIGIITDYDLFLKNGLSANWRERNRDNPLVLAVNKIVREFMDDIFEDDDVEYDYDAEGLTYLKVYSKTGGEERVIYRRPDMKLVQKEFPKNIELKKMLGIDLVVIADERREKINSMEDMFLLRKVVEDSGSNLINFDDYELWYHIGALDKKTLYNKRTKTEVCTYVVTTGADFGRQNDKVTLTCSIQEC